MYRSDYIGPEPPARLKTLIRKVGGVNIFGEANFRLVHSEFRLTPSGGTWVDWAESLTTTERSEKHNKPTRRVVETRWVPLYPNMFGRWILEKWTAPEAYGTPAVWQLPISSGGTMMYIPHKYKFIATLGEYPCRGEYEHCNYVFPTEALTEAVVLTAIGRIMHAMDKMPSTPEGRVKRRCYEAAQREVVKELAFRQYAEQVLDDAGFAFHGQPFVGAGTKRPHSSKQYLKKLGITAHHID
jgi:hypothetical protein